MTGAAAQNSFENGPNAMKTADFLRSRLNLSARAENQPRTLKF
jgi:hypothetical protein